MLHIFVILTDNLYDIVTCRPIVRERVSKTRLHGDKFLETNPSLWDKQTFPWIRKGKLFSVDQTRRYIKTEQI
jgi:hypothetical protein